MLGSRYLALVLLFRMLLPNASKLGRVNIHQSIVLIPKSSVMKKKTILEAITILLVILWCYAGVTKIFEFEIFRAQLHHSPMLKQVATLIAIGLPVLEIVVAILLLLPKTKIWGLYISAALLFLFTVYISCLFVFFSTSIPCSCSGIIEKLGWKGHLIFNITCLLLSLAGIRLNKNIFYNFLPKPKAGFA